MHISDGVLPAWESLCGWGIAAGGLALGLRRLSLEEIPRTALMTAALFLAALVHVPLGPTSVHLTLEGLAGVLLGPQAFLALFVALTLQALLFQFGGIFSLGVNTLIMGLPAALVGWLWQREVHKGEILAGVLAAGAVLSSGLLLALALALAGKAFWRTAQLALVAHLPVAALEGLITFFALKALKRMHPEILLAAAGLLLVLASPARAHRLDFDLRPQDGGLLLEAYFADGRPARGDRVELYCQDRKVAETVTDQEGRARLSRPPCTEVRVVVSGALGHRAERVLRLAPEKPSAPKSEPSPPKHPRELPVEGILSGLALLLALAALGLALENRRRLRELASSRD
ncbi:cobalt transporter CbiM [Thermosulfurimonas marina]|uniref:Cobalt transporter CbiM n=1 Tax=Thermosulfurimonas marina TaxID=2047767 RepID=A0A6H1WU07_9BACT|nr:cobalt transporter CbiM [Thermosulfurimonas marina]QJA06634.1 cobalt transporter CbiM [Thermosulfurimonas marina]